MENFVKASDLDYLNWHVRGAYERANLWPAYDTEEEAATVLTEEVGEVKHAYSNLNDACDELLHTIYRTKNLQEINHELGLVGGNAVKVILEAVQVLSVCNKWRACYDKLGDYPGREEAERGEKKEG